MGLSMGKFSISYGSHEQGGLHCAYNSTGMTLGAVIACSR